MIRGTRDSSEGEKNSQSANQAIGSIDDIAGR